MSYEKITFKFQGTIPLLLHRGGLSDPLDEFSIKIKEISKKRMKTLSDHQQMAKLEFLGSFYMHKKVPVIPADNIEKCMEDSAKKVKLGKTVKAGLFATGHSPIEYNGPSDPKELWKDKSFRLRARVVVQRNSVFRTRPMFTDWAITTTLEFNTDLLNRKDVIEMAHRAGEIVGLGDWRPKYGRFTVTEIN